MATRSDYVLGIYRGIVEEGPQLIKESTLREYVIRQVLVSMADAKRNQMKPTGRRKRRRRR